jgi:hypothetical protein
MLPMGEELFNCDQPFDLVVFGEQDASACQAHRRFV